MATNPVGPAANEVLRLRDNRWLILFFSVLSMVAVANFQYGWTLFVPPLQKHLGVDQSVIQVTFTVFVLLETWLVPFEGALVDRFGVAGPSGLTSLPHPFFGPLSSEEWQALQWRHLDHHLRQFGA